jgi:hypothetical protein
MLLRLSETPEVWYSAGIIVVLIWLDKYGRWSSTSRLWPVLSTGDLFCMIHTKYVGLVLH